VPENVSCPELQFFGAVHFLAPFGHRREGFYLMACVFDGAAGFALCFLHTIDYYFIPCKKKKVQMKGMGSKTMT